MKELRFRLILIVAFVALSVYLLWPTYSDYQNTQKINAVLEHVRDSLVQNNPKLTDSEIENVLSYKKDSIIVNNESIKEAREKRLKLGLDLQGGMYLVMEVNTAKLLERLAKDADATFKELLNEAEQEAKLSDEDLVSILVRKLQEKGIRLSRYFGSIRDDDAQIIDRLQAQEKDAVTRAIEIIRNRVDQYGVSEPSIQQQGARRIIVELPGISKEEEAKRLLQGRALLEFKLVKDAEFAIPIMNKIDEVLAKTFGADSTLSDSTAADSTLADMTEEEFAKKHPFYSIAVVNPQSPFPDAFVKAKDKARLESFLNRPEVKNIIPDNVEFLFSAKPEIVQDGVEYYKLYLVNKAAELTGGVITDAQANIDPQTSAPIVNMQMNAEGAREWARITGANIKKRCAIVLDNVIYSAPTIQNKIPSGRSQISGIPDMDEAKLLEIVLKAGALPAPVDIIEERTV
ncbi:MAG: protein translocase subunit SecD, partial [Ignavibacteria bacterium]